MLLLCLDILQKTSSILSIQSRIFPWARKTSLVNFPILCPLSLCSSPLASWLRSLDGAKGASGPLHLPLSSTWKSLPSDISPGTHSLISFLHWRGFPRLTQHKTALGSLLHLLRILNSHLQIYYASHCVFPVYPPPQHAPLGGSTPRRLRAIVLSTILFQALKTIRSQHMLNTRVGITK